MDIDQSAVKGESGTGYENPDGKGPFECSNCNYFKNDYCSQPIMMKRSKQPRGKTGLVQVDMHACCEYVERRKKEFSSKKWLKPRKSDET